MVHARFGRTIGCIAIASGGILFLPFLRAIESATNVVDAPEIITALLVSTSASDFEHGSTAEGSAILISFDLSSIVMASVLSSSSLFAQLAG